jgi:hypothetical protein
MENANANERILHLENQVADLTTFIINFYEHVKQSQTPDPDLNLLEHILEPKPKRQKMHGKLKIISELESKKNFDGKWPSKLTVEKHKTWSDLKYLFG